MDSLEYPGTFIWKYTICIGLNALSQEEPAILMPLMLY